MKDFPDELLERVFIWLPFTTQVSILPRVSRQWYRVALGEAVIRRVEFIPRDCKYYCCGVRHVTDPRDDFCTFLYFMQRSDKIRPRHLEITLCFNYYASRFCELLRHHLTAVSTWKYLSSFALDFENRFSPSSDYLKLLMKLISCLNPLTLIELKLNCRLDLNVVKMICTHLYKLKKLVLDKCPDLNDDCLMLLSENRLQDLHYFRMSLEKFTSRRMAKFLMVYSSQLEYLHLAVNGFVNDEVYAALSQCRKLQGVSCYIRWNSDLRCLPSDLEEIKFYTSLCTNHSRYEPFGHFTSLRHVSLSYYKFNEDAVVNLCRTNGRNLETLVLRGNTSGNITSKFVDALCHHCSQLVVLVMDNLVLDFCSLFLKKLTDSPSCILPRLHHLKLVFSRSCNDYILCDELLKDKIEKNLFVCKDYLRALAESRPHLTVFCWKYSLYRRNKDSYSFISIIKDQEKMKSKLWNMIGECHDKDYLFDDVMSFTSYEYQMNVISLF